MANQLYDIGRESFLTTVTVNAGAATFQTDWVADGGAGNIHAVLVNGTGSGGIVPYTFDPVNHQTMADVDPTARIADVALTNTVADGTGVASADDAIFTAVAAPASGAGDYIILYRDNGTATDAENLLLAFIDTATNLPVNPNGGDITVIWNGGTGQQIFKL